MMIKRILIILVLVFSCGVAWGDGVYNYYCGVGDCVNETEYVYKDNEFCEEHIDPDVKKYSRYIDKHKHTVQQEFDVVWEYMNKMIKMRKVEIEQLKARIAELEESQSTSSLNQLIDGAKEKNLRFVDMARHGPTCYCKTDYSFRLQNPNIPLCYYWPDEQEHCVILAEDADMLRREDWKFHEGLMVWTRLKDAWKNDESF